MWTTVTADAPEKAEQQADEPREKTHVVRDCRADRLPAVRARDCHGRRA